MYCLTRKTLKCNSLVQKICMFLQKRHHRKNSLVLGPQGHKEYVFGDYFYSNNARELRFHVFLLFLVRKHDIIFLPEVDRIHKKLWILFQLWVPGDPNSNSKFLANSVHLRKNDDVICFLALKWSNTLNVDVLAFFEQKWSPKIYCLSRQGPILCIWGLIKKFQDCKPNLLVRAGLLTFNHYFSLKIEVSVRISTATSLIAGNSCSTC